MVMRKCKPMTKDIYEIISDCKRDRKPIDAVHVKLDKIDELLRTEKIQKESNWALLNRDLAHSDLLWVSTRIHMENPKFI